ncbi:hypothetical protein DD238_004057 [Peronospora effusa]|uniref:Uncharacterized protein n=1 Tax=Peronospora effusa TaxID=542832 RepID=A0A3M6VG95_9STRA|nr:hypothetical protein DD238_004057 [Peronospora effusa]
MYYIIDDHVASSTTALIIELSYRVFLLLQLYLVRGSAYTGAHFRSRRYTSTNNYATFFSQCQDAMQCQQPTARHTSFSQRPLSCGHVFFVLVLVRAASFRRKCGMHLRQQLKFSRSYSTIFSLLGNVANARSSPALTGRSS